MTTVTARRDDAIGTELEAQRQRLLLRALWQRGSDADAPLLAWLRESPQRTAQGLAAYRSNGAALAERALGAAFPTVAQLVGEESFALLARAFWLRHPPQRGDLAEYGQALPEFIADDPQLADEAYLADAARLDWAVHRCEAAADALAPTGLDLLAEAEPTQLRIALRAGTALLMSRWPIVAIWQAHRPSAGADRFATVRAAFAQRRSEHALVWRDGWRPRVDALPDAPARFTRALLDGLSLATALQLAGDEFSFEPWLLQALQQGWLAAVQRVAAAPHIGEQG